MDLADNVILISTFSKSHHCRRNHYFQKDV